MIFFFQLVTQAAQNEKIRVYYEQQPGPLGSSRYPSKRRSLGTEPNKIDRWRHNRNHRGRVGTKQLPAGVEECSNDKNQT